MFTLAAFALAGSCLLVGCAIAKSIPSEREKQTVATANQIISEEYGISFDANDYSYSVREKTSEGDYVPLGDAKEDSRSAGRIISVSALKKNAPEENEMHSYSLEYSLRSNQILHVSVKFG